MTNPPARRRQVDRTAETRAKLIETARQLFAERGFDGVPAEEIVRQAGLTRGALYHHFGGKEGLFEAVYEHVQKELTGRIDSAADRAETAFDALRTGCVAFLKSCLDPEIQRIILLDAPAVLTWARWREVDAQYGLGSLRQGVEGLFEDSSMRPVDANAVTALLAGALNETALWIADQQDQQAALAKAIEALDTLLDGLRAR